MKDRLKSIGINGVLFGTMLNRWVTSRYGEIGSEVITWAIFIFLLIFSLIMGYKTKEYLQFAIIPSICVPLLITPRGSDLVQLYIETGEFVVFFIWLVLLNKVIIPRLNKRK